MWGRKSRREEKKVADGRGEGRRGEKGEAKEGMKRERWKGRREEKRVADGRGEGRKRRRGE